MRHQSADMTYSPASLLDPADFGGTASAIGVPIVYVVRHVQNDDDAENKIRGLKDQQINEEGEKQLGSLRAFFTSRPVFTVVADDLSRTRATALAIAQVCGCEVETDLGLRSWDLGKLEGKSIERHKLEIQDFKTHLDKVPVGGQSWGDFKRQSLDTMSQWVRKGMESAAPIVLVTHGSFIDIFFEEYGNKDKDIAYDASPLGQAGVAALYLTRDGYDLKILRGAKPDLDE